MTPELATDVGVLNFVLIMGGIVVVWGVLGFIISYGE